MARCPRSTPRVEWTITLDGADVARHRLRSPSRSATAGCRVVALKPTDGLTRGTLVRNTGRGISVPVGDVTLGKVWNVIGEPLNAPASVLDDVERALGHPP